MFGELDEDRNADLRDKMLLLQQDHTLMNNFFIILI